MLLNITFSACHFKLFSKNHDLQHGIAVPCRFWRNPDADRPQNVFVGRVFDEHARVAFIMRVAFLADLLELLLLCGLRF